ncbi:histidinol-phosphatase [Lentilitoribacter sp. Alg239-R112]|uniref:histidinol-phosphatase n=1 Tax=Lentilitoribacter sp. Alg239-R112 TaxID=2305987 RepID=UPI0013A70ABC|nr:histidinol-phosphatase [Lentilitoribacter sp. Alg239-R112]
MLPNRNFFESLANAAAEQTLPRFRRNISIENKLTSGFDPVTEADKSCERAIRAIIEAEFPEHGILGEEEEPTNLDSEYVWVIDPIDGTRAFITGLPVWGTLIGLYQNGRAVAGMMDQPFTGERYLADEGGAVLKMRDGVHMDLKTSRNSDLGRANIFTTSPYLHEGVNEVRYDALENEVNLARYGCDCYAFAMVALGTADIAIESDLKPYDIGGLISLVEQAGGVVSTWGGDRPEMGGDIIASANSELHAKALEILNR